MYGSRYAGVVPTAEQERVVATREEDKARLARMRGIFGDLGAPMVRAMASSTRSDFTGDTWAEALAWLRGGITVTHPCRTGSNPRRSHRIRFAADGTIELLAHPDTDLIGEALLHALGGGVTTCVQAHLLLTGQMSREEWLRVERERRNRERLLTLYAAVSWAQRPDTDWKAIARLLPHGVTATALDEWLASGWSFEQARTFLTAGADRATAEAWRAAGPTNARIAALAARGILPDDDARWLAAGFTAGRAQRWRTHDRGTLVEPMLAKRLDDAGWTPDEWFYLQHWVANASVTGTAITEPVAIEWSEAGIEPQMTRRWFDATTGDLDTALAWAAVGISPETYTGLLSPTFVRHSWNGSSTTTRTIPVPVGWTMPSTETVRAWVVVGARGTRHLVAAITSGLSATEYAAIWATLPSTPGIETPFPHRLERVLDRLGRRYDTTYLY